MLIRKITLFLFLTMATISVNSQINNGDLKNLLEKARSKFGIPGLSVVLFNSNEVLAFETAGVRVSGTDNPIEKEDYFHIGSTSKSILACLTGKIVETGKLNWNTKVFDIFPELKNESNPEFYQITIEDLFLCKAGIMAFTSPVDSFPEIDAAKENKRYEFVKWLLKQEISSAKDKDGRFVHLYSNASYTMIAVVLEQISGKTYEILINDFLAHDLKVDHIFGWPNNFSENQPWGHGTFLADDKGNLSDSKKLVPFAPGCSYKLNELIKPAGDISMKALDFAKYTQLHLKGLRSVDNVLKSETMKYIDLAHNGLSLGVYNGKSMKKQFAGFDGSAGTFYCRGFIVPEDDIALTIMINSGNAKAVDWLMLKILKKQYHWWWKFWM